MLHFIERHVPASRMIRVGDTLRLPQQMTRRVDSLTNPIVNRTWEVVAFGGCGKPGGGRHLVIIRRRHDGQTKTLAHQWLQSAINGDNN